MSASIVESAGGHFSLSSSGLFHTVYDLGFASVNSNSSYVCCIDMSWEMWMHDWCILLTFHQRSCVGVLMLFTLYFCLVHFWTRQHMLKILQILGIRLLWRQWETRLLACNACFSKDKPLRGDILVVVIVIWSLCCRCGTLFWSEKDWGLACCTACLET